MQTEARLRDYLAALRRTLADITEDDAPTAFDAEAYRLMASHKLLMMWVLDGHADVDRLVSNTIKKAAVLPPV